MRRLPTIVPICIDCRTLSPAPVAVGVHPDNWVLTVCRSCLISGRWIPLAQRPDFGDGEPLRYPPEPEMPLRLVRRLANLGPRPDLRPLIERLVTAYSLTLLDGTALLEPEGLAEALGDLRKAVTELAVATRGELRAVPVPGGASCSE